MRDAKPETERDQPMIVLSNCLTQTADEGSLNVANSLIKRIKRENPETTIVTYERHSPMSDRHMTINKLLLNWDLIRLIGKKKESVLYVPFPARMLPTTLRMFVLSCFARWGMHTVLSMNVPPNGMARWLMKASGSRVSVLSKETWEMYRDLLGERVTYLKAGVDTQRFQPVDEAQKQILREKYGLPQDKPIVLHVGHMRSGRNVLRMAELQETWHGVLVVSTLTLDEQEQELRRKLAECPNITIIDTYLERIEEIYQLADVYLFPVAESGHCIDVPLSALEAAACGIPVVTTPYGEMRELVGNPGFYQIESFVPQQLHMLLTRAREERKNPRQYVLEYDWNCAVEKLLLK